MKHYSKAIMGIKILTDDKVLNSEEELGKYINEIGIPVHFRLSYCYMLKEEWKSVIYYTNKVLQLEPQNAKAVYRRCLSYIKLNDADNALKDLRELEGLIKDTKELEDIKKQFEDNIKSNKKEEKHLFKKMMKTYKKSEENKETEENKKRCINLIMKLPQTAVSLAKLLVNYTVVKPTKFFFDSGYYLVDNLALKPIKFTYNKTTETIYQAIAFSKKNYK